MNTKLTRGEELLVAFIEAHAEYEHDPGDAMVPSDGRAHEAYMKANTALRTYIVELEKHTKLGDGTCVCPYPPGWWEKGPEGTLGGHGYNMELDHRCPCHGEKAQPAVWGRHKDLTLAVSQTVWNSLGVVRT